MTVLMRTGPFAVQRAMPTRPLVRSVLSAPLFVVAAACGGERTVSAPAAAPPMAGSATTSANGSGAPAAADDPLGAAAPSDFVLTANLAAMRADPSLAPVVAKAEQSAEAPVRDVVKSLDAIEIHSDGAPGKPSYVALVWGKLARDPSSLRFFGKGSAHPLAKAASLPSGVDEYTDASSTTRVFVVSDAAWVLADGSTVDAVRARLTSTPAVPKLQADTLLHVSAHGSMLEQLAAASPALGRMQSLDVTLRTGMTSLEGALVFREESDAKAAEGGVKAVSGLLLMAAAGSKECKAFDKISVDVARDGKTVNVGVKGIADAAAAWTPACGGSDAQVASSSSKPPARRRRAMH